MVLVLGCTSEPTPQDGNPASPQDTTTVAPADTSAPALPPKPNCPLAGKVLENNQFWASTENLVVAIVADKETEDPNLGDSHRILVVYDGANCQQVFKQVLPVNLSADYPYYLSDITYNKVSSLIAIRGFDKFYIFNLATKQLSAPLAPKFLNKRMVDDAQSGAISRMEVWESYLIGHAASMGPFVYDLRNPAEPTPVMPTAEFAVEKGVSYNSLFLLKSLDKDDGYQALLPSYDYEKEEFEVNALFPKPLKIDIDLNKPFKNNRYIVLHEAAGAAEAKSIGIDMSKKEMVALPEDVAKKKDTEIIQWMKNR